MSGLTVLQGCSTIQLPKGLRTLVDSSLYRLLNSMTWGVIHAKGDFIYPIHQVRRLGQIFSVKMHQFVANPDNGIKVDHKNRDTLDNRGENLRIATMSENGCNKNKLRRNGATSQFKGVSRRKEGGWAARITKDGVTKSLGNFRTEADAARAYDEAAREMHGEFALTNLDIYGHGNT